MKETETYIARDCFALGANGICRGLNSENCLKCNFYKSKEQMRAEQSKCKARLIRLGEFEFLKKYYSDGVKKI